MRQLIGLAGRQYNSGHPNPRGKLRLKHSSPLYSASVAAVAMVAFAVTNFAQSPTTEQPAAGNAPHHHEEPAPTNLKVLPKDMTGEQVHQLMHQWDAELGTECETCHAADPNRKRPNGKPILNFADDSKPEKNTARLMYKMLDDINKNYVSTVENSGVAVACGTCHRGHLDPPIFSAPKGEHDHDHEHPAAPAAGDKPGAGN